MQEVSAMPENDFACEDIRIFEMFPAGKILAVPHSVLTCPAAKHSL